MDYCGSSSTQNYIWSIKMKQVKFTVTEAQYTFLKNVVGFDNIEKILWPIIDDMINEKNYERIGNYK